MYSLQLPTEIIESQGHPRVYPQIICIKPFTGDMYKDKLAKKIRDQPDTRQHILLCADLN
ncbi:hypothetical protein DPMN_101475 [Dreissena polymorpha]|uniref:Uncharacterized protein n=1 Tax=Dreissena polymorpha TaxID=45954 RepID=A0A9D4LIU0_DREPO|nr:hypothetical protein DPMN_101475 [Dreissena polymorpha]